MQDYAPSLGDSAPGATGDHDETQSDRPLDVATNLTEPGYCRLCDRRVLPTEPGRCPECGTDLALPGSRSRSAEATRAMKAAQATKVAFDAARAGHRQMEMPAPAPAQPAPEPPQQAEEDEFPDYFKPPGADTGRPTSIPARPAPVHPPRVAGGTAVASPHTRIRVAAMIAILAAAGVIVLVFTPWFGIPFPGGTFSGWRVTTELTSNGQFPLGVWNFFQDGFSPFFSGLTGLGMGFMLAGAGLVLLSSPMIPQPATTSVRPSAANFIRTLGWLATIPPVANLASFYAFPMDTASAGIPWQFEAGYGLILSPLLAVGAAIALHTGCTGSKSRVAWR